MEVAGFSVETETVPIKDTVGGVRVLLDFMDQETGADRMKTAGWDEDRFTGLRLDGVDEIGDGAFGDGFLEIFTGHAFLQADVEFRSGIASGDEPHFGFGFSVELGGEFRRRMDLDREVFTRIEDFDEDGKPFVVRQTGAEEFLAMVFPEIVEGFSSERSLIDDGLFAFPVHDFP